MAKKNLPSTTVIISTSLMDKFATANRASITLMTTLRKIRQDDSLPREDKKIVDEMLCYAKLINEKTSDNLLKTIK